MNTQFQEQQNYVHVLKTENNSLKIHMNQLKQTVEGQKAAYENLRTQLANVYKEHQKELQKDAVPVYVPKVNVSIAGGSMSREPAKTFEMSYESKAPMNSRWAKPMSEITRPAGYNKSISSTPRPNQFSYKSSLTRNNQESSMMEKYCSNSVSEIMNWGFQPDASVQAKDM